MSSDFLPQDSMDVYVYGDVGCRSQQYTQHYVVQRSNFFGDSIVVLSGISCDARIDLYFV